MRGEATDRLPRTRSRGTRLSAALLLLAIAAPALGARRTTAVSDDGRDDDEARASLATEIERCERLLAAGSPEVALTRLSAALEQGDSLPAPVLARAWALRAQAALASDDPELALASAEEASRRNSASTAESLRALRAEALLEMGRLHEAAETVATDESDPGLRARAHALEALGRRRAAAAIWTRITAEHADAEALHRLGVIAYESGEPNVALERFEAALRSAPGHYLGHVWAARAALDARATTEAAEHAKTARAIARTPEASYLLGRALAAGGRHSEAIEAYRAAVDLDESYAEALFALARSLRATHREQEARRALERYQEIERAQWRDRTRASELVQRAKAAPEDVGAALALAEDRLRAGDGTAARDAAWAAVRLAPRNVAARLALARAYRALGRYRAAAVHFRHVLRVEPKHLAATEELSELIRRHARAQ